MKTLQSINIILFIRFDVLLSKSSENERNKCHNNNNGKKLSVCECRIVVKNISDNLHELCFPKTKKKKKMVKNRIASNYSKIYNNQPRFGYFIFSLNWFCIDILRLVSYDMISDLGCLYTQWHRDTHFYFRHKSAVA